MGGVDAHEEPPGQGLRLMDAHAFCVCADLLWITVLAALHLRYRAQTVSRGISLVLAQLWIALASCRGLGLRYIIVFERSQGLFVSRGRSDQNRTLFGRGVGS